MPSTIHIPSRLERHCEPCQHHKCIGSFYVRCGEGSWRDYNCMHPDAFEDGPPHADPEKEKARQRLIGRMSKDGRNIGKTEEQPNWCPLRRGSTEDLARAS